VSWHHAVLRVQNGRWQLFDGQSTNGTFADGQLVREIQIDTECMVRFGHPSDGPVLHCTVTEQSPQLTRTLRIGRAPDNDIVVADAKVSRYHAELHQVDGTHRIVDLQSSNGTLVNGERIAAALLSDGDVVSIGEATFRLVGLEFQESSGASAVVEQPPPAAAPTPASGGCPFIAETPSAPPAPLRGTGQLVEQALPPVAAAPDDGTLEIPYAIRWLVPNGERFANFHVINDNDTQLDYYRKFGHIYAVGVPTKKWRLVVVSDPGLLDQVAADEEQFGKRVEEINFFTQLANSRGAGISVIGDGEHTEHVRRVMLPWYSTTNQRTQLVWMKEQARKLVAAWSALPANQPLEARAWMERYTLEVSGRGACNYDFGLFGGATNPHPFATAVPESTKESIRRVADPRPDFTLFASRATRARVRSYRRNNVELVRTADALVRARMHTGPQGGQQNDLLSRLVSTPDPETGQFLDAESIRDQILMHLSNGFNGPSITGAWLAHVLGTHPDVEARLIAEIDGITAGDPDYDLQYDDLQKLPYMTQVIRETLRIYPPMPVTIRRSFKDGALGPYRIRKDDIILIGTLAAQRDPRYWGPNPDKFDPDQFEMDRVASRPRNAFIPFSIGRRQCMAQEVTFMMLRVVLFEIYRHFLLRPAPGTVVTKNTVVTTKPGAVPIILVPRDSQRRERVPASTPAAAPAQSAARAAGSDWGEPTEIPETSAYRHLVIAYGSNFGANKDLAERFAERAHFYGYTSEVITLNQLAESAPRSQPWLLVVMTSTYTANPPSNAAAFKALLERTEPGTATWRNCRYLVWGLGNSQWLAYLAFPRFVQSRLAELGASQVGEFASGDVGSPAWEALHADWNNRVWPVLLKLSEARPTAGAAARLAAENAEAQALTGADSNSAIYKSLYRVEAAAQPSPPAAGLSSIMRLMSPGSRRRSMAAGVAAPGLEERSGGQSRVLVSPTTLTNTVGISTFEARARVCRELQAAESPRRTRHLEVSLPAGVTYLAGDHLGVCPKNDEEHVERIARHLGVSLEGLFMVPKTMTVHAVPKGEVLQVRNVLTNLLDITGRPTVPLVNLMVDKATDPAERLRLTEISRALQSPEGADEQLRTAIDAGAYDVLRLLDEFPSCSLNIFEFLGVAQQLRPRYYSTSSSPRMHGDGVAHITVGLETSAVPGMADRDFRGMSSHYVHTLRDGDRLNVFVDSAAGFRLQDDVTRPMIFISVGTGFAPMRAFLWERLAMKQAGMSVGEAALFNGIRSRQLDYIYREEIEQFVAEGVLDHVHIAASREQPGRRDYVQDLIRQEGALVWRLVAEGACVYVCGSRPLRDAVRATFVDVIEEHGSQGRAAAEEYLLNLETTARYRPDLWS
jgi:cytochrome P450/NADPH-cytochrome P450 reductase